MTDFYNRFKFSIILTIAGLLLISLNFYINVSSFFNTSFFTLSPHSFSENGTDHFSPSAFFNLSLCVYPLVLVAPIYISSRELLAPFLGIDYSSKPWHYPLVKGDGNFVRVFIIFLILLFFPYYASLVISPLFSVSTVWFFSIIFFVCFFLCLISFFLFLSGLKKLNLINKPILELGSVIQEESKSIYLNLLLLLFCFWNSFIYIAIFNGPLYLLLFLFLSALNDTVCYLLGSCFGKTKFTKHSPNKTIEGLVGGVVLSSLLLTVLVCCMSYLARGPDWYSGVSVILIFLLFCIVTTVSNVGDLYYSKQKRQLGIKDFSHVFGSHGGFADRFDSHCFVLSLLFIVNMFLVLLSFFLA